MKSIKIILILALITFSFILIRSFVHSETDPPDIPLEGEPRCIVINPSTDQAVVASTRPHEVSIVDLAAQAVITTIRVGKRPLGVAIDSDLNYALVSSRHDDTLSMINLDTYRVIATIPVGRSPEGIAVNKLNGTPHVALVANNQDNSVSVIDLGTLSVIRTIDVGRRPRDIAIDSDLGLALVVNEKDKNVSVIDLETYEVTGSVPVGKKPRAISINPETHVAVVTDAKADSISVINLQNWQTTSLHVEDHPIDVAVNPLDNRALVLCDRDKLLLLIDLNTNTVIESYSLNKKSRGIAVNHFTNIAAVIDDKTDSLTLYQLLNPVPEITSVSPNTLIRGSGATKVRIEGSGFIKTSTVPGFEVDFIDNHHLEVTIPANILFQAGVYQLVVTNPAPDGGSSNPVSLYVNNLVPTLTSLNPESTMAGTSGLTLMVNGTGFFSDTTVSINGLHRAFTLIIQTQLQIALTGQDLEVGGYLNIRASNPSPGGGPSNTTLTFTVLNPEPSLLSIDPSSIIAGSPDFTLILNGDNFVRTSIVNFNGQQLTPSSITKTRITVTIPSTAVTTAGSYSVTVISPAPGGGESNPLTFTVKPPLEIKIISPLDGETINKSKTIVRGTIKSDTKDVGITVNGLIAEMIGNDWVANNVPLTIGSNAITAVATDSNGNIDTKTITVFTNDITQFVELTANVTSGIAPLQIYFSVSNSGFTPVLYQMDFEGDGVFDYTGTAFDDINYIYTTEGIFYPTITVTDDHGNTYLDTIAITVLSKTEIDILLNTKWNGMKQALMSQDIEGAILNFTSETQEIYKKQFTAFKPILSKVVNELNSAQINLISLQDNTAQYEILVTREGTPFSFDLKFMKDVNGVWKIWRY